MNVAIVGAGHAGAQMVGALRVHGWHDRITLIGTEIHLPYHRPPLSKGLLAGQVKRDGVLMNEPNFYKDTNTGLQLGHTVQSIDRHQRVTYLDDGNEISYDYLVLATGAQPKRLNVPGVDLKNVFYLRSFDDTLCIRERLRPGARLVVVGGGYIGLEVAAVAAKLDASVTVLEMSERPMARVTSPEVSDFSAALHRANGVDIRTHVQVKGFEGNGDGEVVQVLTADDGIPADVVVIGVGISPATGLADSANLPVENGILVDHYCRTADERIFAAGDCTNHPSAIYERRIRLENVQNATDQAITAAKAICGKPAPYDSVPWFWSDQYDTRLQICGLSDGYDERVVRGDPNSNAFSVFYLKQRQILAVEAVNSPREYMMGRRLIAQRASLAPHRIRDCSVPIKNLA